MQPPPPLVPPPQANSCPESSGQEALRACQDLQHMIDINSAHLERLRTTMANSASGMELLKNTALYFLLLFTLMPAKIGSTLTQPFLDIRNFLVQDCHDG